MAFTLPDFLKRALALIPLDMLIRELRALYHAIVRLVEKIPPPSAAPGHQKRKETVDRILDDIASALAHFATRLGIHKHGALSALLRALKPWVSALIVWIGDINEQYSYLFPTLTSIVVVLLFPESFLLKSVLNALGFGPLGPISGSVAAWMQSTFFGAAVPAGSWFAVLQAAGMGVVPVWLELMTKAMLIAGLFMFKRRPFAT